MRQSPATYRGGGAGARGPEAPRPRSLCRAADPAKSPGKVLAPSRLVSGSPCLGTVSSQQRSQCFRGVATLSLPQGVLPSHLRACVQSSLGQQFRAARGLLLPLCSPVLSSLLLSLTSSGSLGVLKVSTSLDFFLFLEWLFFCVWFLWGLMSHIAIQVYLELMTTYARWPTEPPPHVHFRGEHRLGGEVAPVALGRAGAQPPRRLGEPPGQ